MDLVHLALRHFELPAPQCIERHFLKLYLKYYGEVHVHRQQQRMVKSSNASLHRSWPEQMAELAAAETTAQKQTDCSKAAANLAPH